jgi:hypothetical protein
LFDIFFIELSSSSFRVSVIIISPMLLRAGVEEETWLSASLLKSIDVGSKWLDVDDVALLAEDHVYLIW